jgi:hypothetical protein
MEMLKMTSNTAQNNISDLNPADFPPGFLDEPLTPQIAAKAANKTPNALAVDRCRGKGVPYSKADGKITYTRRDIYEHHRQHRCIPQNN